MVKNNNSTSFPGRLAGVVVLLTLAMLPMFQTGCFRPMAALSFVNKEDKGDKTGLCVAGVPDPSQIDHNTQLSIQRYGSIVRKYSGKYDLDWRLVLALMRHESRFSATATSYRGAYGLMQIMPGTQVELAEKLGVPETETPYNNIKAGIFHFRSLYSAFDAISSEEDRVRLSLAAYNAGLQRIFDAQDIASYLGDDPNDWGSIKAALPLLSKRYHTLHQNVWESGRPRAGYFGGWRQTQTYVDSIMSHYDEYQLALR